MTEIEPLQNETAFYKLVCPKHTFPPAEALRFFPGCNTRHNCSYRLVTPLDQATQNFEGKKPLPRTNNIIKKSEWYYQLALI